MKKILLLGSGELGKEFVIAAQRKGQYVIACDSYAGAPAMQVADECEVFSMLDGDALERVVNKHNPDIIVPEIEAIRTERLYDFEQKGIQVVPSARAVNYTMNRKAIRDLAAKELGLKTARYYYAKSFDELKEAAEKIGFPCVVKPLMSSSGKGQSVVKSADELEHAWEYGCSGSRGDIKELIIEEFIKFDVQFRPIVVDGDEYLWGTVADEEAKNIVEDGHNIADLEYFCMGARGDDYRLMGYPNYIPTKYLVDPDSKYDTLDIHYAFTDSNEGVQKSEKDITIVCVDDGSHTDMKALITAINQLLPTDKQIPALA